MFFILSLKLKLLFQIVGYHAVQKARPRNVFTPHFRTYPRRLGYLLEKMSPARFIPRPHQGIIKPFSTVDDLKNSFGNLGSHASNSQWCGFPSQSQNCSSGLEASKSFGNPGWDPQIDRFWVGENLRFLYTFDLSGKSNKKRSKKSIEFSCRKYIFRSKPEFSVILQFEFSRLKFF